MRIGKMTKKAVMGKIYPKKETKEAHELDSEEKRANHRMIGFVDGCGAW